ncbi:unnamed protein product [Heligmosomoides polygyrus]|uniref:Transposase n=1 Tax=Heligmosomoides polygyrus TaxID=6339 RepID=A0A183FDM0_HELPZ|nr:unnamed protein product [Heligmosomoides polygyrus]
MNFQKNGREFTAFSGVLKSYKRMEATSQLTDGKTEHRVGRQLSDHNKNVRTQDEIETGLGVVGEPGRSFRPGQLFWRAIAFIRSRKHWKGV